MSALELICVLCIAAVKNICSDFGTLVGNEAGTSFNVLNTLGLLKCYVRDT